MTYDRLAELERLVDRPDAHGFRAECRELLRALRPALDDTRRMREFRPPGDANPRAVADACDRVAGAVGSPLHEAAALMLRRLMGEMAAAQDAAADAGQAVALLRRLVANQDTRCQLDHHGYCQEHDFAAPCPVPEAQKLTGSGTEYVPTVGR